MDQVMSVGARILMALLMFAFLLVSLVVAEKVFDTVMLFYKIEQFVKR